MLSAGAYIVFVVDSCWLLCAVCLSLRVDRFRRWSACCGLRVVCLFGVMCRCSLLFAVCRLLLVVVVVVVCCLVPVVAVCCSQGDCNIL